MQVVVTGRLAVVLPVIEHGVMPTTWVGIDRPNGPVILGEGFSNPPANTMP